MHWKTRVCKVRKAATKTKITAKRKCLRDVNIYLLLSRFARELKVVHRIRESNSAAAKLRRSPGLTACIARPSHPVSVITLPGSGSRAVSAVLQSRDGDGFAPSSRARSFAIDCGCVHGAGKIGPRTSLS